MRSKGAEKIFELKEERFKGLEYGGGIERDTMESRV